MLDFTNVQLGSLVHLLILLDLVFLSKEQWKEVAVNYLYVTPEYFLFKKYQH